MSPNTHLEHGTFVEECELTITAAIESTSNHPSVFEVELADGTECFLVPTTPTDPRSRQNPDFCLEERYRFKSVLVADPDFDENTTFAEEHERAAGQDCPRCGGPFTFKSGLVTPPSWVRDVFEALDTHGPHLVVTPESRYHRLSSHARDDWRPFSRPHQRQPPERSASTFQCADCHLEVPEDGFEDQIKTWTEPSDIPKRAFENKMVESVDAASPVANAPREDLGMAVGGAKDTENFRENIHSGYLPSLESLTYEGLFYDYYFDTGTEHQDRDALFYPSYATAISTDPLSDETEYYLTVGLNSTLSADAFERPQLNLVAVLDVSGSMGRQFDQYYYDENGNRQTVDSDSTATKMEAATDALAALTHHLNADDRFGVILYNTDAHRAKPLTPVGETDMDAIRGHIRDIQAGGGTNMSAGLETAIDCFEGLDCSSPDVENRLVFLTDMMPNTGATGRNTIAGTIEAAADRGIHTTFIGMGLDANPDLIETLSKIRGANHYFVNSAEEFSQRLDDEFEYMVTPLVFDLQLELTPEGLIDTVYGSPNADHSTGQLIHVATLFPSPTTDGESRGGVILLRLTDLPTTPLKLTASWEERDGTIEQDSVEVAFPSDESTQYSNTGIRKAIVLARYARSLRDWIRSSSQRDDWNGRGESSHRSQWEQSSTSLTVPAGFEADFDAVHSYLTTEMDALEDPTFEQELDVLETLMNNSLEGFEDLSSTDLDRLRELIALAPTKNAELKEAWDLEDGSAVHQYLESHLSEYYYRDEEQLIRPTDDAVNQLQESSSSQ